MEEQEIAQWLQQASELLEAMKSQDPLSGLENGLQLLEKSGEILESNKVRLDSQLQIFEQSMKLSAALQDALENARKKVDDLQDKTEAE